MNVSCPECSTVYRVDPAKVPQGGVRARCSSCGGVIPVGMAAAPAPAPLAPRYSQSPPEPAFPRPEPASNRRTPAPPFVPARQPTPAKPSAAQPPAPSIPPSATSQPFSATPDKGRSEPMATPAAQIYSPAPRPTPISVPSFTPPSRVPPASLPPTAPAIPPSFAPQTPATASTSDISRESGRADPTNAATTASAASIPISSTSSESIGASSTPAAGDRRPINPFLSRDPGLRAKRLARALVSDMVAYYPAKHAEGLEKGTLKELFRDEIRKSYEEYMNQVGADYARSTTHFQESLNEVLGAGKKIF
ncbi:MAG TPA: zinc-ribbon domain-containing protein [Gemmatimonadaceae bacterium]|nr:zinc-ribbon domain-containing protein [Gemmatimonadaceae bacterium]